MKFDLVRPCPHCPFRQDIPAYLRGDRAQEIATALAQGGTFACHQTTVEARESDENCEMMEGPNSQMCAGAMRALMQSGGSNQIMRIAERTGVFDPDQLDRSVPVGSLSDFVEHHSGDDDRCEHCNGSGSVRCHGPEDYGVSFESEECEHCGGTGKVSGECCSVVDAGCLHPAGILMGGTILPSEDKERTTPCEDCGEYVCENCSKDGVCNSCLEYDEEES